MMQPRQTTASKRPDSAAARAAWGISNAPGTANRCTCASVAPASLSAPTAASRRLAVISSLNRETMTAKRNGEASGSGAAGESWERTLLPLELRFALLEEGRRPLAHVVGAGDE